jgi:SAM-dependent methyltransferase
LVRFHQRAAHPNRISKLAEQIGETIEELFAHSSTEIRALDVGCGDMSIAERIQSRNPRIQWTCTDIHELPQGYISSPKWSKYRRFDGSTLPFPEHSFDVVLFSDVLHHCMDKAVALLQEALRVGSQVIVKDHFEYGWSSRQMLRLMDFIGNYGYGVKVPNAYFTQEKFREACHEAGARIIGLRVGIGLYADCPLVKYVLKNDWQFIAVLAQESHPETR